MQCEVYVECGIYNKDLICGFHDGPNKVDVTSTFYQKHISVWVDPRQF